MASLLELRAEAEETEGLHITVALFCAVRVFHRPHPRPEVNPTSPLQTLVASGVRCEDYHIAIALGERLRD